MRSHAIRVTETGGPDVLKWQVVEVAEPGPGEVLVTHEAVGLNYIDTYHRTGLNPVELPFTPGVEAAGTVETVGPDVFEFQAGDRVAYCTTPPGSYAEQRVVAADRLVPLPVGVAFEIAAAALLKGMTVEYLIHRTYPVATGDTVLWHAAAGGVGLIACQWLKRLGATVIGTVGSEEKAELARARGCDHTILYRQEDVAKRVRELTDGRGVPVAYDAVGAATRGASLDSLAPRGIYACFGNASGPPEPVAAAELVGRGSLYFTRPSLAHYAATGEDLLNGAKAVFDVIADGLKVEVNQRFALEDAGSAHRALEARETTGSTVLLP